MDKRKTKQEFIKEIRQYLAALNTPKGEHVEINETVSTQTIKCGEHEFKHEIRVKWVSNNRIFIEWYNNNRRADFSGEYTLNNHNVSDMILHNVACALWSKTTTA